MKNKILKLSSLLFATIALSSCLKDKGYDNRDYQLLRGSTEGQKVVSIALRTDVNDNSSVQAFSADAVSTTVNLVPVTLSGGIPAAQDVHVVLALDPTLVTDYNTANGTSYVVPGLTPLYAYTIPTLTVTIPKGQSTAYMQMTFIPANFLGSTFALGVKIVSVDGGYTIAGNGKGVGVAGFTIRNAYEGDYLSIATRTRYNGATDASGVLDQFFNAAPGVLKTYTTSGATSIRGGLADSGSGITVDLTILPTNVVNVIMISGGLGSEIGTNISTGSSYDPATKTFTIAATYHATSGNQRKVVETLVKQ